MRPVDIHDLPAGEDVTDEQLDLLIGGMTIPWPPATGCIVPDDIR